MDPAVRSAKALDADIVVAPFPDPIGRDTIVEWPGGVHMQLYWHTTAPNYAKLQTVPENRVYVSAGRADEFIRDFVAFSHGKLVSDDAHAPGIEIGRPNDTYRRVRIESGFGKVTVLVSDGHLPYPYGRELTGYEVANLADTLSKAKAAGATVVVEPYTADSGKRRWSCSLVDMSRKFMLVQEIDQVRLDQYLYVLSLDFLPDAPIDWRIPPWISRNEAVVHRLNLTLSHAYSAKTIPSATAGQTELRWWRVPLAAAFTVLLFPRLAQAQDNDDADAAPPARPAILASRWEEDWSVLADPRVPREPFDNLKYIPLSPYDPKTYLSLGADFRERFEAMTRRALESVPIATTIISSAARKRTPICISPISSRCSRRFRATSRPGKRRSRRPIRMFSASSRPSRRNRAGRRRNAKASVRPAADEFRLPAFCIRSRWAECSSILRCSLGQLPRRPLEVHHIL